MKALRRSTGPADTALSLQARNPEPTAPVTPNQGGVLLLCRLWGVILEYSQLSPSCQFLNSNGSSEEGQEEPHFLEALYVFRGISAALCTD